MLKRKKFILGATAGLTIAAAATAGGVISWPGAHAEPVAGMSGRLVPSAGAAGLFAPPQGAPLSFADIFQQVAPAVVQIDVKTRVNRPRTMQIPGLPFQFQVPQGQGQGQPGEDGAEGEGETAMGAGSGFFISADGYIVTNNHVVADAEEITVILSDERELTARLVGRDEATDLAVIKVDGGDFPFVSFEEQAQPRVGDWVIAVGNPFGLGGTATAGIVSASARGSVDASTPYTDYLQIDAAINRGNSGGPTFDIYGRVIGVNSAIYSPTGGSVGIGFAIPAGVAKPITDRLMRGETIERGYLGVEIGNLTREYRETMGLPADTKGAFINNVTPGGPAERGGLQAGDIVTRLGDETIDSSTELTRLVGQARPGDTIRLQVLRDGRSQTLTVRSGTRPSEATLRGGENGGADEGQTPRSEQNQAGETVAGLTLAPLNAATRERYAVPATVQSGVVVTEAVSASARGIGFQPGFIILRAGNSPVNSVADVRAAEAAARAANRTNIFLLVRTPAGNRPVVLELPREGATPPK
ncbi:MAG: Do family serine endopeptidase [Brevundimonas sp.]|nr:MAG: Do family serine endopeptidase [Brevundimonas sp.]